MTLPLLRAKLALHLRQPTRGLLKSRNGRLIGAIVPTVLLNPVAACSSEAGLSVCDEIERANFTIPVVKEFDGHGITRGLQWSPNGRRFFAVTESGHCDTNLTEAVIWVFSAADVRSYANAVAAGRWRKTPIANPAARLFATANDELIKRVQWLSTGQLIFLGRNRSVNARVYTVSPQGGDLRALTPDDQDVSAFAMIGDRLVYTTSPRAQVPLWQSQAQTQPEQVIDAARLELILSASQVFHLLGPKHKLWIADNAVSNPVIDPATGRQIELYVDYDFPDFFLSSNGRYLAAVQTVKSVPEDSLERSIESLSDLTQSPCRKVEIDLESGRIEPRRGLANEGTCSEDAKIDAPESLSSPDVQVYIRQDLNLWPKLYARSSIDPQEVLIWDPSPQLAGANLIEASVIRWKDANGIAWTGGLVVPRVIPAQSILS